MYVLRQIPVRTPLQHSSQGQTQAQGLQSQEKETEGMAIISKFALNQGMSQHVLIVYRKVRPKLTFSVFAKIFFLGLLEPVIDQNLYYTGMKYTTATFTSAMCNILPAFAFLMAWICGLEKVSIRRPHSQAKVLGTTVTVGGAMLMTLFTGPMLNLPWTNRNTHQESTDAANEQDHIKGALMVISGSVCWSGFIILQAITLRSYPAQLSLTVLICLIGTLENTILALVIEWGNPTAWSIHMDTKLLAALYGVRNSMFSYTSFFVWTFNSIWIMHLFVKKKKHVEVFIQIRV
ncbi:hypothetical protein I3842_01G284900 [Carya illinoinensis]|uniref:WAT1-related protein n=1 Tax=Carya illinoinensis TaxID=32201 RepID=A0A922G6A1_CARIL|nr:hypothetical protein I3842_01G284900 [Carya illinoinensis]